MTISGSPLVSELLVSRKERVPKSYLLTDSAAFLPGPSQTALPKEGSLSESLTTTAWKPKKLETGLILKNFSGA